MTTLRIFFTFAFVIFSIFALERALAVEYQPDTREALAIRPEMPVELLQQPVPCLRPPERPKPVVWVVRDKDGNILIIGSQIVRQRC